MPSFVQFLEPRPDFLMAEPVAALQHGRGVFSRRANAAVPTLQGMDKSNIAFALITAIPGACLTHVRLLRLPGLRAHCALTRGPGCGLAALPVRRMRRTHSGIFGRSFHLHSVDYARETIAQSCSLGASLATAPMSQTGSCRLHHRRAGAFPRVRQA